MIAPDLNTFRTIQKKNVHLIKKCSQLTAPKLGLSVLVNTLNTFENSDANTPKIRGKKFIKN